MYNANGDKLVRKFLPVQLYDIHGMELWFEELSAQGLILDSFGIRSAIFRVGNPEPGVRYRLEPMTYWDRSLDYEKNDAYAQEGWEYVDFISRYYYIYRCRDSSAPDLHTDPVTQSLVFDRMFKRRLPFFLLAVPFYIQDYLYVPVNTVQNGSRFLSEILYSLVMTPWLEIINLLLIPWAAAVFIAFLWRTWKIWQLRCRLKQGIPLDEGRRYPRSLVRSALSWCFPAACLLLVFLIAFFRSVPPFTYYQMLKPETQLPAPLFSLYDVELEEGYELPFNNDYERSPSPFSVNYTVSQGFGWKDNIRGNLYTQEAQLAIVLYDTRSPAFAQSVLDRRDKEGWHKLSHPGIDELYANAPHGEEPAQGLLYLLGRAGNRYISIYTGGVQDPWTHIDRFLSDLARTEHI